MPDLDLVGDEVHRLARAGPHVHQGFDRELLAGGFEIAEHGHDDASSVVGDGAVKSGWLRRSLGESAATTTGRHGLRAQAMGAVGVEVRRAAGLKQMDLASNSRRRSPVRT